MISSSNNGESPWPWMEGALEEIPPVNEHDKRPAVKGLIAQYRSKIDVVKAELESSPLYNATQHDDLWIVRFLISHKGSTKKASKAAKSCLEFRKEHQFCQEDIRYCPITKEKAKSDALKRYLVYCGDDFVDACVPDNRCVIIFIRFAALDQHGLAANVDEKDWLPCFAYINEWCFQWCDYITRTSGRLAKLIRIVDTAGVTMAQSNSVVRKRDLHAMDAMEDFYPQLLQSVFVCNAPSWVQIIWRIFKLIIPKRTLEKFDFLNPLHNKKELKKLLMFVSIENLPVRFGGKYEPWPMNYPLPSPKKESQS